MNAVDAPPLTVEDYRLLPDAGPRYQLIEGELHMAPAPSRYHQDILLNIVRILDRYLEKHPGGKLYVAPFDVCFDEINVHQPDIVYIGKPNLKILTTAGAEGAPDFIVEILSPKTAHLDKKAKRRVFARSGVKELWLVDPEPRQVSVYHLQNDPEHPIATHGERESFASVHFPGLRIRCARIFKP